MTYEAAASIAERDWRDGSSWERWDEIGFTNERTGLAAQFRRAAAPSCHLFSLLSYLSADSVVSGSGSEGAWREIA